VLVDVATRLESRGTNRIKSFMLAHPEGFASLEEAGEAVRSYLPSRHRPGDPPSLRKNLRLHPDGRYRWHWDPKFMTGVIPERARLEAAASNLDVPTLLVRGMSSDVLSMEGVREFMERVPHAVFENVQNAEHMVAGDRNDVFNQVVARFLQVNALGPEPC
jgi:non-heme chloroperoxidase